MIAQKSGEREKLEMRQTGLLLLFCWRERVRERSTDTRAQVGLLLLGFALFGSLLISSFIFLFLWPPYPRVFLEFRECSGHCLSITTESLHDKIHLMENANHIWLTAVKIQKKILNFMIVKWVLIQLILLTLFVS